MVIKNQVGFYMFHLDLCRNAFQHNAAQMFGVTYGYMNQEVIFAGHMVYVPNLAKAQHMIGKPEDRVRVVFGQPHRNHGQQSHSKVLWFDIGMKSPKHPDFLQASGSFQGSGEIGRAHV